MSHGKHSKSTQLLRGVKHHRRETTRHFGVQPNLDTGLDLILTLHQQVQKLLSVDHGFTEVCHQTNQSSVPLVHNLRRATLCKTMHKMGNISFLFSVLMLRLRAHTLVKVVDPEAIRICRTLLWNLCMDSSSTRRKHCAVLSFVT